MERWKGLGIKGRMIKKINNSVLVGGLYTRIHAFQLQISLPLICRLDILKMWEPRLWYHRVTPQSHGYGDVTMTWIHGSKIPSCIYTKHQYMQESEYGSRGALYIPTYEYNCKVITRCDTILQEYYITDGRKYESTKRCTSMNSTNGAHEFTKGKLERRAGALEG